MLNARKRSRELPFVAACAARAYTGSGAFPIGRIYSPPLSSCRDGGIGRRSGFKIHRSVRTLGVRVPLPVPGLTRRPQRICLCCRPMKYLPALRRGGCDSRGPSRRQPRALGLHEIATPNSLPESAARRRLRIAEQDGKILLCKRAIEPRIRLLDRAGRLHGTG